MPIRNRENSVESKVGAKVGQRWGKGKTGLRMSERLQTLCIELLSFPKAKKSRLDGRRVKVFPNSRISIVSAHGNAVELLAYRFRVDQVPVVFVDHGQRRAHGTRHHE